jgi:hypothetical protein
VRECSNQKQVLQKKLDFLPEHLDWWSKYPGGEYFKYKISAPYIIH